MYLINDIASKPSPWISCDNKELQILHKSSRYEPLNTRVTPIVQQFESKLRKVAFAIFPAKNKHSKTSRKTKKLCTVVHRLGSLETVLRLDFIFPWLLNVKTKLNRGNEMVPLSCVEKRQLALSIVHCDTGSIDTDWELTRNLWEMNQPRCNFQSFHHPRTTVYPM